jgi:phage replication-related protein YjqB (UPF0714/DUF867 family)
VPLDRYRCFAELEKNETRGEDYLIFLRKGASGIAVMAPHGGGIEFGTDQVASAIAHPEHTFWAFRGIKKTGNGILHIASTSFDVPEALEIAVSAKTVITLHGCHGEAPVVYVGGRHARLKRCLRRALSNADFDARFSTKPGLKGESPFNLCNRGGGGVQLEISAGLRKRMFTSNKNGDLKKEDFLRFTSAVKTVLVHE